MSVCALVLLAGCAAPGTLSVAVPQWRVGEEWTYRYDGPGSAATFVWAVDRDEVVDGQSCHVIKSGNREIFCRTADFALVRETVDGTVVRRIAAPRSGWRWVDFPLTVGKTWEMSYTEERPADGKLEDVQRCYTVGARETIDVPAGALDTLRIACVDARTGASAGTIWYGPPVRQPVKGDLVLSAGKQVRELTAYRLR
jgi:hypothetical protein